MDAFLIIVVSLIGLLVLIFLYVILDSLFAKELPPIDGIVLEKDFTPEDTRTGIGPAIGGGGGIAITTSHSDEKWVLIIEFSDGDVQPVETEKETWLKYNKGDKVKVSLWKGLFGGISLGSVID